MAAVGTGDSGTDLAEVVVTAQRTDTNLSKTPVAVAVISADTLDRAQIVTEDDLRFATPGLSVRATLSSNQLNYALRGQSQDAFSGTRPGVLPYINDVQIGGSGGSSQFYDLQSVQVLKGPQGTLFGRSATGGAVLFETAKPTEALSGYVSASGGNYGLQKYEAAVSGPIAGDALLGRVSGFYEKRDGFQNNLYDNEREGNLDRYGFRASLTGKLGDRVRNDLVVDYFHAEDQSTVGVIAGLLPFTGVPGQPPYIPSTFIYAGAATPMASATGIGTLQALTGTSQAVATAYYNAYFSDPRRAVGGLGAALAAQQARGPFTIDTDSDNISNQSNVIVTNATTFKIDDNTQLKNIFGYTHLKTFAAYDADGTADGVAQSGTKEIPTANLLVTKQLSEEFQLLGKALDGRLAYVTGVYYSDEKNPNHQHSDFFDLLFGGETVANDFNITNKTYAGYAQATYQLNDDGLAVTAGTRYTSEQVGKIEFPTDSVRLALGDPAPPGFSYDQSTTYNKVSWQFGIQDQINSSLLLYADTARAYKSGGYNGTVTPKVGFADTAGDAYKAERVTDLELGTKFQGHVAGMPTRVTAAIYYNWLVDSQRTAFSLVDGNPASLTINVPKGSTYGVEVEGLILPVRFLTLGGTFNYTRASYGSDPVSVNGSTQEFDQVPDTPKYSGLLYAEVDAPLTDRLQGIVHGEVYRQDRSFTSPQSQNSAGTTIPAYNLANFRIGIEDIQHRWTLTANLKNAFNKVYYVGGISTGEIYQINTLIPGEPRTVTVEARYNF